MRRSEIEVGKTYHNVSKPPFYAERKVTAIFNTVTGKHVRFDTITGPLSHYEHEGYPDGEMMLEAFARWAAGIVE